MYSSCVQKNAMKYIVTRLSSKKYKNICVYILIGKQGILYRYETFVSEIGSIFQQTVVKLFRY